MDQKFWQYRHFWAKVLNNNSCFSEQLVIDDYWSFWNSSKMNFKSRFRIYQKPKIILEHQPFGFNPQEHVQLEFHVQPCSSHVNPQSQIKCISSTETQLSVLFYFTRTNQHFDPFWKISRFLMSQQRYQKITLIDLWLVSGLNYFR